MLYPSTDIIMNAQQFFAADQSEANLVKLLHAVSVMLQEGAEVLIPTAADAPEGQLLLQTQTTDSGLEYMTAYSSKEAYEQGEPCNVISRPLVNYFEAILQKELLADAKKNKQQNAISVWRGDITTLDCDAIVNAANSTLLGGGGVDGAIHRAAGPQLLEECKTLGGCTTGAAKITYGYNLPASYIIHTVGPIYNGKVEQRLELADCYKNSLDLARKHHLHSIAFPAISTGAYAYPVDEAARIALLTCTEWINANADYGMSVVLTCFNSGVYNAYQELVKKAQNGELD